MLRQLWQRKKRKNIREEGRRRERPVGRGGGERQNRDDPGRERTCTGSSFVPMHFWICVSEKKEREREGKRKKEKEWWVYVYPDVYRLFQKETEAQEIL